MKKQMYFAHLQTAKIGHQEEIQVKTEELKLHLETLDRALIAYMTVEEMLKRSKNDPEQSEEFNKGVSKCLELMQACETAIITNPDYDLKEYYKVAVDNQ